MLIKKSIINQIKYFKIKITVKDVNVTRINLIDFSWHRLKTDGLERQVIFISSVFMKIKPVKNAYS
jgi:hypothetical protein